MALIAAVALAGIVAAGIPQDVYDAPPLRADIAALYEVAIEEMPSSRPNPDVLRRIALAHATGDGVQQDPLNACAFAQLYQAATRLRYYEGHPEDNQAAQLVSQMCASFTRDDMGLVGYLMGCPLVGFPTRTIVELEPGWWLILYERHLVIEHPSGTGESDLAMFPCGGRLARIKHTALAGAAGTPARHVIEAFMWLSHAGDKGPTRALFWTAIEVRAAKAEMLGRQIWSEPGSAWPDPPPIPPVLARGASFRIDASGRILYDIARDGEMPRAAAK